MTAMGDLGSPLAILGGVLLVLLIASRVFGFAARLGIWISQRFAGPDELYGEGRAADGRVARYGRARTDLEPRGKVFLSGELWDAVAEGRIAAGDRVEVVGIEGLELHVRHAQGDHEG